MPPRLAFHGRHHGRDLRRGRKSRESARDGLRSQIESEAESALDDDCPAEGALDRARPTGPAGERDRPAAAGDDCDDGRAGRGPSRAPFVACVLLDVARGYEDARQDHHRGSIRSAWKRDLRPRTLALSDICHKDQTGSESESVDTYCARQQGSAKRAGRGPADVPGIVVESRANPCGARFTMLDGAHRICRLKQGGAAAGRFFVFDVASAEALVTSERAPGKRRPQPRLKTLSRDDAMDLAWWLAERHYDVAG